MIYVVGTLALDTIIYCPRMPLKNTAVQVSSMHRVFGGTAGNVAAVLSALGERASVISLAGEDFPGSDYDRHLKSLGVETAHVSIRKGAHTSRAYAPVVESTGELVFYFEPMPGFSDLPLPRLGLSSGDFIHIATGNPAFNRRLAASTPGARISFDPGYDAPRYSKDDLESIFRRTLILSMNETELDSVLKTTGNGSWKSLFSYGIRVIVITHGERGSEAHTEGASFKIGSYTKSAMRDPIGAGDAYRAGFLAAYAKGMPVEECAKTGSAAASLIKEHVGGHASGMTLEKVLERAKEF
ncbi:MAG: carbohydrate kinase family protein [Candidatus ainarchaeum sp.]|nr:carbohydrate kinase family protein [Candidatus ainarchaeum sp.]